jgi:hypothetical protein
VLIIKGRSYRLHDLKQAAGSRGLSARLPSVID